ncbi:hypothetical protein Hypma_004066 [Hypsizygus marmoreus]|uniref:Uncharacterized protein n=1 Tax=Hypsizygus marmoreus TaxID=39966 RepID=A0A369J815_HYPMA|nr:hypothetical protein Hypma_004066 [Hypsizygus marmoreus]
MGYTHYISQAINFSPQPLELFSVVPTTYATRRRCNAVSRLPSLLPRTFPGAFAHPPRFWNCKYASRALSLQAIERYPPRNNVTGKPAFWNLERHRPERLASRLRLQRKTSNYCIVEDIKNDTTDLRTRPPFQATTQTVQSDPVP